MRAAEGVGPNDLITQSSQNGRGKTLPYKFCTRAEKENGRFVNRPYKMQLDCSNSPEFIESPKRCCTGLT